MQKEDNFLWRGHSKSIFELWTIFVIMAFEFSLKLLFSVASKIDFIFFNALTATEININTWCR